MSWFIAAYLWVCLLFGFWYFYPKMKANRNVSADGMEEICAVLLGLLVTPWYWPLMVVYLVEAHLDEEKDKVEQLRRKSR